MDDSAKQIVKYGAMALAAYFVYDWLQSSGLWAKWFGGPAASTPANQFSTSQALLNYCHANPSGTAIYLNPSTGVASTAPCSQWIASNSSTPISTTPPVSVPAGPSLPVNLQQAIAAMQTAAGSDSQTLDIWAYYWQNGTPFANSPSGYGVSGSITPSGMNSLIALNGASRDKPVSASQFVQWLNQTGTGSSVPLPAVPTGGSGAGLQAYEENYEWVN